MISFASNSEGLIAKKTTSEALRPATFSFDREGRVAKFHEQVFMLICLCSAIIPILLMIWLLGQTILIGFSRIDLDFLSGFPSRFAKNAGILPALVGSLYLMGLTGLMALPLGVCSAIYLEEYAQESWFKKLIEINVSNLAGVPSIIFGILGLELFVRAMRLGPSILAGSLTLALLSLPIVITASREAIKSIPTHLKEASFALGATRLSVIRRVILPLAMPQIITGAILSMARAIGESAPIIVIGAASFIAFLPNSPMSEFSAMPLQIFQWVERPQREFLENASAAIVVLLMILILFNALAAWLRHKHEKN